MTASANHEFAATVLQRSARALASYAAGELVESVPDSHEGCGPDPFSMWRHWLLSRMEDLAAAVAASAPELFVSQVRWGRAALEARGVRPEIFRAGLESLRQVLAKELPAEVERLATGYLDRALRDFDKPAVESQTRLTADTPAGRLAAAYLFAVLEGDRRRARETILNCKDPMSIPELYTEVLLVAQEEIGRMWLANEITVAEEHFATNTTRSVMAQLLARAPLRPRNGKTVLAAAVAGNRHDIGLLAVADFFEMDGWRVIHLGADVPVSDVVESVRCFHADLLALSASQPPQIQTVRRTLDAVRASRPEQPVKSLIGGRAFLACPNQALELGGDAYAENALEAVRAGDRLLELSFHQGHFSGSPRS